MLSLIGWPLMPPLAFTQSKYALAMFGMSVNEVPGWLVAMAPSGIGVPVALTPGLLPHCDVSTAAALVVAEVPPAGLVFELVLVLLVLLLQPAAARASAAASMIVLRAVICLVIYPPQGGEFLSVHGGFFSIHGHHDLDRVGRPAQREGKRLGRAGQREMVREHVGDGRAAGRDQVYRLAEIGGG